MAPATAETNDRPAAGERRGSTRHAGLERDDVVARALAIVEERGADALSMRKLAADLGVTTTTIYWHVGSRDDLIIAVIRRLAEQQAESRITGSTPRQRVASAARNIWSSALAHRNVTALANQVGATTMLELPLEIALAAELEAAGVRGSEARDALRAILSCIAGYLVMAWRAGDRIPEDLQARHLWSQVDDPRVGAATLQAMTEPADLHELFETTLSAVVAAFVPARPKKGSS